MREGEIIPYAAASPHFYRGGLWKLRDPIGGSLYPWSHLGRAYAYASSWGGSKHSVIGTRAHDSGAI